MTEGTRVILDPRRGVLLEPMDPSVPYVEERATSLARYRWGLMVWRRRYEAARAANDYAALDRLDQEYEMVGMP